MHADAMSRLSNMATTNRNKSRLKYVLDAWAENS